MMMRQGPNNNNKNRGPRRGNNQQHGGGNNGGGNRRPQGPNRNQNFDSNGPDVRIRGSAYQVFEKYLNLARDATAAGDRVMAESYYQHAEHYHRVINIIEFGEDGQRRPRPDQNGGYGNNGQNQSGFGGEQGNDQNGEDQQFGGNNNDGQFPQAEAQVNHGPQPYGGAVPPEQQDQPDIPAVPQRREYNETKTEERFEEERQPE